jgi:hypothetical protein
MLLAILAFLLGRNILFQLSAIKNKMCFTQWPCHIYGFISKKENQSIIHVIDFFWLHFLRIYYKKQSYGSLTFYVFFVREAKARYMIW